MPRSCATFAYCILAAWSLPLVAQESEPLPLPVLRVTGTPPAVVAVGGFTRTDGSAWQAPVTASLGVADLRLYATQLNTLFPRSIDRYPADSLAAQRRSRAAAWIDRLRATHGAGVEGRQLLAFAEVALRAEDDTLAIRLVETRLRAIPPGKVGAVERSFVLGAIVELLTTRVRDSALARRRLHDAEPYATQLLALPTAGYALRSDSTDILYRQFDATCAIVWAGYTSGLFAEALDYGERALTLYARLGFDERRWRQRSYPYRAVAESMLTQPNGRARLDSLNERLLAQLQPKPTDSGDPVQQIAQANESARYWRDQMAWMAMIGQPAPPILVHAQLNAGDSAYAASPRSMSLSDGTARILVFGDNDSWILPTVDRLYRQLPRGIRVQFVTQVSGAIGPDIAAPDIEVAWLNSYYRGKRHLVVPIAVWAGGRQAGAYGTSAPSQPPFRFTYHTDWLSGIAVLVDGGGIVRAFLDIGGRDDEASLAARAQAILDRSAAVAPH